MFGSGLLALLLGVPALAIATQMHFRDVPLQQAVQGAQLIAEVEALGPQQPHAYPERLRIIEVFYSSESAAPSGEIDAFDRRTIVGFRGVAASRATGVRRSPIVQRLRNGLEPVGGGRYCVILTRSVERGLAPHAIWSTTVSNAYVAAPCRRLRRRARRLRRESE